MPPDCRLTFLAAVRFSSLIIKAHWIPASAGMTPPWRRGALGSLLVQLRIHGNSGVEQP